MEEIDYSTRYWFLVEVGHLEGRDYGPGDLFRFQPPGRELFSEVVLFGSEELARKAADHLDNSLPARKRQGMRLEVHTIPVPKNLAAFLERSRANGVLYVSFCNSLGDRGESISVEVAIVGFRSV